MDCLRAVLNLTSKSLGSCGLTMKGKSSFNISGSVPQGIWILDSGATNRMVPFPSYFTSYLKVSKKQPITIANGDHVPIVGSGNAQLQSSLSLHNILHDVQVQVQEVTKLTLIPKQVQLSNPEIILSDLKVKYEGPIKLLCDNNSAISIIHNLVQHDRTKHMEIDRYFIHEKLNSELVVTTHVPTRLQVADVFTKGFPAAKFQELNGKLEMIDIHLPT
ncbi:Copia protein, partial [Mucuna pruriens]